jgi:hypothetical protein
VRLVREVKGMNTNLDKQRRQIFLFALGFALTAFALGAALVQAIIEEHGWWRPAIPAVIVFWTMFAFWTTLKRILST